MDPSASADESSPQPALINRRSKPQLSCNFCRRGKLRCDRAQPCSTCAGRGLGPSCTYQSNQAPKQPASTVSQRRRPPKPHGTDRGRPQGTVHDRLGQLERIVISLMQNTTSEPNGQEDSQDRPEQSHNQPQHQHPVPPAPQDQPPIESPEGAINPKDSPAQSDSGSVWFNSSDAQYVGGTHWAAILDGIADLKEQLEREDHGNVEKPAMLQTFLLYGCKFASKEDILAALPDRHTVDRYVSQYFNRLDLAPSCLHSTQFTREYEQFWENPAEASVMWLGLLFSIMCLAVLASSTADSSSSPEVRNPLVDTYREKIVQCLILGEYTKAGRYVLETLFQYLTIEYSIRKDADRDIWILSGISVNIALRMGYHRDPSHLPGISPFAGEMRRRAWATILQGDILISTQMGMPRMIKDWQCDTVEPRNLNDGDFDEGCLDLPLSRPETEITTVSHLIARRRIIAPLGAIVDFTASVRPVAYSEAMRLDRILHDAEATIPSYFRMKAMAAAVTDPPQVIMHRLFLRLMFHKAQIMLHCKYLSSNLPPSEGQLSYTYSHNSCIEAALGILEIQRILDEETCPDGQLYMMRWRASSFMKHEFLTATMLLCFLARQRNGHIDALTNSQTVDQIMVALATSHGIWERSRNSSMEAKTAADTLNIVLSKEAGESMVNADGQMISNDFTLKSGQLMPFSAGGLDGNGMEDNFFYGYPFIGTNQMIPGSAMMDNNLVWQWQHCFEMGLPQDPA